MKDRCNILKVDQIGIEALPQALHLEKPVQPFNFSCLALGLK
jgi:hypothetical protein